MNSIRLGCFLVSAVSSYAALLYKLGQIRRGWRDVAFLALMATLVLQCVTFTMGAVSLSSDALLGVRNLAILFMHLAAVAFCVFAEVLLLQWAHELHEVRRRVFWWLLCGFAVDGVLVVLFIVAEGPRQPQDAFASGSSQPLVLTYLLVFIVSQAVPCWSLLSSAGICALSIGLTMPSWGLHVSRLAAWGRDYASYRALHPLWDALCRSFPDVVLEPPTASVLDLRYRLHRRVVEIRDGWRALRPYMDRSASEVPEHLDGRAAGEEERQALGEAASIDRAIRARRAGVVGRDGEDVGGFRDRDSETLAAEVAWPRQVSVADQRIRKAEVRAPSGQDG